MADWIVIIEKAWGDPSGERWNNTYEVSGTGATSAAALAPFLDNLVAAERSVHLNTVLFLRARVGKWEPVVDYYDPFRFVNVPIGLPGQRALPTGVDPTDLELCWKLRRGVNSGNPGMINFRGVMTELEVSALATGKPRLVAGSAVTQGGSVLLGYKAFLTSYMTANATIFLAMIGRYKIGGSEESPIYGPVVVRRVNDLTVYGAGRLPLTHKTKDRLGPDVGDGVEGGGSTGPFFTEGRTEEPTENSLSFNNYSFSFGE